MDEGPNNDKGKNRVEEEVKYRGVKNQRWGKYAAYIRDTSHNGKKVWLRGTFNTSKEAARAHDRAAFDMMGHLEILNFPQDYNLPSTLSHFTSAPTPIESTSGSQQEREVFVFEYFDNQLLEDLLDDK